MGLDQYANAVRGNATVDEDGREEYEDTFELSYWRKHPDLQGWMEELWREKGGEGDFNCKDVELTLEDLDELEQVINAHQLPETVGFFFGTSNADEIEHDRQFVEYARRAIVKGYRVLYSSWY